MRRVGGTLCSAGVRNRLGDFRKLASRLGWSNSWCMRRIWVAFVTIASFISLASIASESFQAALFYPRALVYSHLEDRWTNHILWERSGIPSLYTGSIDSELILLATSLERGFALDEFDPSIHESTVSYVEDVVALPEGRDLFLVRHFSRDKLKGRITACNYGARLKAKLLLVDLVDGRLAVSCTRPSAISDLPLRIMGISLEVDGGDTAALLPKVDYPEPASWDSALVYAVQITEEDVIVYAKGLLERRTVGNDMELKKFRCVFGTFMETEVTTAAQEVFRCAHPKFDPKVQPPRVRWRVQLKYRDKLIPSIAYYHASWRLVRKGAAVAEAESEQKRLVCACTMVWNSAKFLKEWVLFHSDLGVEKFFVYDNNSEDSIDGVVSSLSSFNLTKRSWPWVKTQEAGFSHCAVEAQRECDWILFTDVDEYVFPKRWLGLPENPRQRPAEAPAISTRQSPSPLAALIEDAVQKSTRSAGSPKLGQISLLCRNFGPSGLLEHPQQGLTQGYTCREKKEERHKSMVFFPALKKSLQNLIHHFELGPEYQTMYLGSRQAVVNHYKYQAWSEFQTKFTKRASTYVVDWKEPRNLNSRDRPVGVGPEAIRPVDWEASHCEVNDTALRDYTRARFQGLNSGNTVKLPWDL